MFTAALLLFSTSPIIAHPQPLTSDIQVLERGEAASIESRFTQLSELWKRKGGGGKGGKGGSSSSSSGTSSSGYVTSSQQSAEDARPDTLKLQANSVAHASSNSQSQEETVVARRRRGFFGGFGDFSGGSFSGGRS